MLIMDKSTLETIKVRVISWLCCLVAFVDKLCVGLVLFIARRL